MSPNVSTDHGPDSEEPELQNRRNDFWCTQLNRQVALKILPDRSRASLIRRITDWIGEGGGMGEV